ncbi:MAG: hypothetical protein HJJLKODD_01753 [Phycisphaerae bacterium]|nr:hypothetical protein [Phycisphaerae bacterium]
MLNHIDFTPKWYRQKLATREDRRQRLIYLTVLVLLMGGWFGITEGRIRQAQAVLLSAQKQNEQAKSQKVEYEQLRTQFGVLEQQLASFHQLSTYIPKSVILAELSHCLPDQVRLVDIDINLLNDRTVREPNNERIAHCDLVVEFTAQAVKEDTLLDFVSMLKQSKLFELVLYDANQQVPLANDVVLYTKQFRLYVYRAEHIDYDEGSTP